MNLLLKKHARHLFQIVSIITIIAAIISVGINYQNRSVSALSKHGSTETEVTQIQTKLKEFGFYSGNIDGIFGDQTKKAVELFQESKKLKVDGIAGPQTLKMLGLYSGANSGKFSSSDINLLARVVSAESRDEPYVGQVAVASVILNRIEHPSFPNTLAGVIYQPGAFTCMADGQFSEPTSSSSKRASQDAINGWDPSGGAIYYYNPVKSTNKWIFSRPIITVIANHRFCS